MGQQLIHHDAALRLFFTEEIYLQPGEEKDITAPQLLEQVVQVVEEAPAKVFKYLGKNQAQILILVQDEQEDVSSVEGRELLRNLVKAIQLTANDFALLNFAAYQGTQHVELFDFFKPKLVLSFGISAGQLGLSEIAHHELVIVDGIQMIFAGNLANLASDQNSKKILWGSLKKLQL